MIELDISNVWTCVTLPELLGSEKEIFDAHLSLQDHEPEGPDFLGWLSQPDHVIARLVHGIRRRAAQICETSDVLVVCGSSHSCNAARAAISCYCGGQRNLLSRPQVFFIGESLSGRQWLQLQQLLEERDYSLHIISPGGDELGSNVAARGLRWMMERKYGPKAKQRISIATCVGTSLHKMGQEEDYELFPMPKEPGGDCSGLNAGALLPMAVAGIDPLAVLEGAVEGYREMDIRSFENPAWLYTAARCVLPTKGRDRELMCISDERVRDLCDWWSKLTWSQEKYFGAQTVLLPGDLQAIEMLVGSGKAPVFETVLRFEPISRKIPVEMDWKDYDGLGFLSGKHLDFVETAMLDTVVEQHNRMGVPVLEIRAGELTAQTLGQLLYFFELTAALTATVQGRDPFAPAESGTSQAIFAAMQQ